MKKEYIAAVLFVLLSISASAFAAPPWPILEPANRFVLYGANQDLVYDRVTNLIWERTPSNGDNLVSWPNAVDTCFDKFYPNSSTPGATRGWRLPTVEELSSLQTFVKAIPVNQGPSNYQFAVASDLFQKISGAYWSGTTQPSSGVLANGDSAYVVGFGEQSSVNILEWQDKFHENAKVWCVRGGSLNVVPIQFLHTQ